MVGFGINRALASVRDIYIIHHSFSVGFLDHVMPTDSVFEVVSGVVEKEVA